MAIYCFLVLLPLLVLMFLVKELPRKTALEMIRLQRVMGLSKIIKHFDNLKIQYSEQVENFERLSNIKTRSKHGWDCHEADQAEKYHRDSLNGILNVLSKKCSDLEQLSQDNQHIPLDVTVQGLTVQDVLVDIKKFIDQNTHYDHWD